MNIAFFVGNILKHVMCGQNIQKLKRNLYLGYISIYFAT